MQTIHMIHGYIGVGKTTFAQKLETNLPALRFTHDHWMTHLYGADPPADKIGDYHDRVASLIKDTWTRCAAMGNDIVLDLNFWTLQERDETRTIAADLGAQVKLYNLTLPDVEAWARVAKRNGDLQGSFQISENTYDILKAQFEPLTADELQTAMSLP